MYFLYRRDSPCAYDLYLLTDVDVPWINDGQRYMAHARGDFFARCKRALQGLDRPHVTLSGGWEERFHRAVGAIENIFLGTDSS